MRLIDADKLKKDLSENYVFYGFRQLLNDFYEVLDSAPTIKTKQVKYFDEDESVWKVGEVIVRDSEKPNNSKVSEIPTGSERSSE
jgi:hypothetical protein